jgi:FMN phosphatase YigB (HAD superfamily)
MGVRGCFVDLCGADLVDNAKASQLFYERVFGHAGVAPNDALVVDDSERALDWAADLSAQTILRRPRTAATCTCAGWLIYRRYSDD